MNALYTWDSMQLSGRRILLREDLNVPMHQGQIQSSARLKAAVPTLRALLEQKPSYVLILSHLGQPKPGESSPEYSLEPVAKALAALIKRPIHFLPEWPPSASDLAKQALSEDSPIFLMENLRLLKGETENQPELAESMAAFGDVFIMDAFACAHRAHASTVGIAKYVTDVCAGPLLLAELQAMDRILTQPKRPLALLIGGAKIASKLAVLRHCLRLADHILIGGGMAHTFLMAQGYVMGASLVEPDCIPSALEILSAAKDNACQIHLPVDGITLSKQLRSMHRLQPNDQIADIGPETLHNYQSIIATANTVVFNGPMGIFEQSDFSHGTLAMAKAIAESKAFSLVGGGDTLSALEIAGLSDQMGYVSTGGGAMLAMLGGEALPGVQCLKKHNTKHNTKYNTYSGT